MRIVIPGIDASQSGLGRVTPLNRGLPADGLQALYHFNSGVIGQAVSTFEDLSGRGKHAALHGTYAAPVQRAWGLEVQHIYGLVLNTGVPLKAQSTIIIAMEMLLPGSETNVYQFCFSPSSNNIPLNAAQPATHWVSPAVNFNGHIAPPGDYALFDGTPGQSVLGTIRLPVPQGPANSQPSVLGLRIDAAANRIRLRANIGEERAVTRPGIGEHYATDRGTVFLGAWSNGSARTAASPHARLFGAAIYDRTLSDEHLRIAMQAIRRPAESAGIVFAG